MSKSKLDYIRVHGIGQKTTKQYEDQFLKPIPGTLQQGGAAFQNGVVQLRDVKVGRDCGVQSEILSGVSKSDKVIVNPSDSLTTGTTVRLAATAPTASTGPEAPKK